MVLGVLVLAVSGCYHATIETGLAPSTQTVEEPWAAGWIGGLLPPSTVETAAQCPDGVARVETKHSFLNGLVAILTGGIFTPMHIEVTCAASGRVDGADSVDVGTGATMEEKREALIDAARLSAELGSAVFVAF